MNVQSIALIGPSGSGKSSIGVEISRLLEWRFCDTDREIEHRLGKTVAEIFSEFGEGFFRQQEKALVEEFADQKQDNLILSTGGGLPIYNENLKRLQSFAITFYLTAPLEVLVTRISSSEDRPLLGATQSRGEQENKQAIISRLGKLIAERANIYERAQYRIDTSSSDVSILAFDIIRLAGLVITPSQ